MERIVFISWEKVSLVIPEKKDFSLLLQAANNINITQYWGPISHRTYESEDKYLQNILEWNKKFFMIMLNDSRKVIGSVSFHEYDDVSRQWTIWISLYDEQELWKWYGTEAMGLFLKYSFEYLWAHKVKLYVFWQNQRAIASYKKNGFREVWVFKEDVYIMWKYQDRVAMEMLKSDWIK